MAELRVKSTGTLKLFESDNTSSVTIASPASLGGDRTITLPDADVTLGDNTPAFEAYLAAAQTVTDAAQTKVTINTEVFDTDSDYDHTTNYRFTPTTAGKYFCYGTVTSLSSANSDLNEAMASFQFNGSRIATSSSTFDDNEINMSSSSIYRVITFNGSSDYLELYGRTNINSGTAYFTNSHEKSTMFGAYRIIGV
jgi:hypothetical protein